jgi:hypothetical protein
MVAVLVVVAVARLRLLNFPLERDEGEYAYAGQLMLQGIPPYQLAYNMKFPGTYAAYAAIMALFGQTPAGIHFGVLCLTTLTALMLFWLGKQILDWTAGMVATTSYAVMAASPAMLGLAGHATHFAAFFATAGLCLMWKARQNAGWLIVFAAGLLFGVGVLMKQHVAFIGLWAVIAFIVQLVRQTQLSPAKRFWPVAAFGVGMILPFSVCCLILWHAGVFEKFWFWTIRYAHRYASLIPISAAPMVFWKTFCFVTVNGFLLWLVVAAGLGMVWFDKRLRPTRLWLLGFSLASALTICPGFYFRKHYYLLTLPAAALLAGCAVSGARWLWRQRIKSSKFGDWPVWCYALMVATTVIARSGVWFVQTPTQASRTTYGADPFPEAQLVASYIRANSSPGAHVAILGSEPEIYFLSQRHSATGYIYTYGLMEPQPFARQMQSEMIREIETDAPEFVVFADNSMSWWRYPGSDLGIFDWWNSYQTNYTLVAISDVISPTETISAWGTNAIAHYHEAHGSALEIYQRKAGPLSPQTPSSSGKRP